MVSKISRVGLLIPLKVFLLIIVGISFGQEGSSLLDDFGSGYPNVTQLCPTSVNCSLLPADCIQCEFNFSCRYGQLTKANCTPTDNVMCEGNREFSRELTCRYCYQLPLDLTCCTPNTDCNVRSTPRSLYISNCSALDTELCLPPRQFNRKLPCNYTTGVRWSTAFLLSLTLGGFGVDRFYLGHWGSAIGKLFSFGGLGVWSILDVILVATGYLTPENGSAYIY